MPRYFFNLMTRAGSIPDLEGSELPDLEHARLEAISDARSLMAEAIRHGRDISSRSIQISDEAGKLLQTLHFVEVVTPE